MKKILLSLFLIFTLFITSCSTGGGVTGVGAVTITQNNGINKEILDSGKSLDDQVLDDLKNNNLDKILEISSEEFKQKSSTNKEWFEELQKYTKDKPFDNPDRYYCEINKVGKYNFAIKDLKDDLFSINLDAIGNEMFISLFKTKSQKDDFIVLLIYIKEQGKWKLNTLSGVQYSYDGMNAIDLYEKAKSLEAQGYAVPANIYMGLCSKILRPAPFIQYKKESEINDYGKKLNQSITDKYAFPEKLKNTNNVELYGFRVEYTKNDGIIPVVRYVTSIGLDSSDKKEKLGKEANDMNKEVTDKYPGLKANFKYVLYEAYSEPPIDPKKTYPDYRTGVEQK